MTPEREVASKINAVDYVDSLDVTLLLCAVPEREVQVVRLGRHAILPNVGAGEETPSECSVSFCDIASQTQALIRGHT